jgi:hypothetical protein
MNEKLIEFLRTKPPTFGGSVNPLDADDWLRAILRELEPFTELTLAMLHSSLQWRGWVSPRELAEQRRGVIPRRVMARICRVRALNARTHVREQVRL